MEMNRTRAVDFLRKHQPLPADADLDRETLNELDQVRRYLTDHPDEELLDLLMGTFGDGTGFGLYQLMDEAVAAHETETVVEVLRRKLEKGPPSVRKWTAELAASYPDDRLLGPLVTVLKIGDYDTRYAAVTALQALGTPEAIAALRAWLPAEQDEELREVIRLTAQ